VTAIIKDSDCVCAICPKVLQEEDINLNGTFNMTAVYFQELQFYIPYMERIMCYRLNRRLILSLILFVVSGCAAPKSAETQVSSTATSNPISRYGTFDIKSIGSSNINGVLTATDNGDGSTLLSVQLNEAAEFHPWGIYNTGDCVNGVPIDTRPIFTLPDIENGAKEETVETEVYKSTPGNLIVIIYGIASNGIQNLVACATLGPPTIASNLTQTTSTENCISLTPDANSRIEPGSWLAFTGTMNSNSDIYILNVDEGVSKRLTTHPATDFDPTWSPDGKHIAFRSQRDGNDEIYIMNADGSCQINLTNDPANDWSPAWSPDGKQIAFARSFDNNPFTDIVLMNIDGSNITRLTYGHGEYPAWSPDGKHIAFASARDGNYEIYVMNADGTNQTRLTDDPAYDMSPSWSPDGTQIVFDTQRDSYPLAEVGIGPEFEIHIMNADGSGDTRLTNNMAEDRFPSWSIDGKISYSSNGSLFIMDSDGSNQIKVLDSGGFPDWRNAQP